MTEGFTTYLSGIGRVAQLSPEEELELGRRVQAGIAAQETLDGDANLDAARRRNGCAGVSMKGEAARRHLTEANLRLVVYLARGYQGRGVPFADLVQEGNVGLMAAATRFRPEKGWRFSTYAGSWIRSAMLAAITDQGGVVRMPANLAALATQIHTGRAPVRAGEPPSPDPGGTGSHLRDRRGTGCTGPRTARLARLARGSGR